MIPLSWCNDLKCYFWIWDRVFPLVLTRGVRWEILKFDFLEIHSAWFGFCLRVAVSVEGRRHLIEFRFVREFGELRLY